MDMAGEEPSELELLARVSGLVDLVASQRSIAFRS